MNLKRFVTMTAVAAALSIPAAGFSQSTTAPHPSTPPAAASPHAPAPAAPGLLGGSPAGGKHLQWRPEATPAVVVRGWVPRAVLRGSQLRSRCRVAPPGRTAGDDLHHPGGKADQDADLPGIVVIAGGIED